MIERLLELMRMKNMTSSQLADAIGVQRSGISHFVSGRNKPSLEFILKILTYFPDVNPDWLLFGKEDAFRNETTVSTFEGAGEVQTGNTRIALNEDIPVSKPSFMEDLFSESGRTTHLDEKDSEQIAKNQATKQRQTTDKNTKPIKKETTGDEFMSQKMGGKESLERIVMLYKNKTFREYFPE